MVLEIVEQTIGCHDADLRMAEFALVHRFRRAAQLHRHGLHTVANTQQRHAGIKYLLRCAR